jgi:hypothetical protein
MHVGLQSMADVSAAALQVCRAAAACILMPCSCALFVQQTRVPEGEGWCFCAHQITAKGAAALCNRCECAVAAVLGKAVPVMQQ